MNGSNRETGKFGSNEASRQADEPSGGVERGNRLSDWRATERVPQSNHPQMATTPGRGFAGGQGSRSV